MSNVIIVVNKVALKGILDKTFLEKIFSKNNPFRMPLPSGLCRRCGKGRHWTNECRSTRDCQGNPLLLGKALRDLLENPMSNLVQSFPITVEKTPPQSN